MHFLKSSRSALVIFSRKARGFAENVYLRYASRAVWYGWALGAQPQLWQGIWAQSGFAPFRQRWWIQWQLEPFRNRLRYAALCERARVLERLTENTGLRKDREGTNRKLIVIQLGHLGDLLHTVPALRQLRSALPWTEIVLVVGPWNREGVARIPYVDRVVYWAPRWEAYARGTYGDCLSFEEDWKLGLSLRREGPDIVVDATSGSMPTLFLMLASHPEFGLGPELFPGGDYVSPRWYKAVPYDSQEYEAKRLLRLFSMIASDGEAVLEFPVTDRDRQELSQLLATHALNSGYVAMAPGAGWPGKIWPSERFIELGKIIVRELKFKVVVIGTRSERRDADNITKAIGGDAVNLAGKTTIGTLGALLERARGLVTNDNGAYHIAVALKVPTVLLFGPGFPSKWVSPHHRRQRVLYHNTSCSCFPWHPRAACKYDRACMRAITVQEVWDALQDVIS